MNRVAEWRKKRNLSQAGLAERMGTTQPTVQRLETGAQTLTEDWMMRLSNALDISPIDLLGVAIVAELRNEVEPQLIPLDESMTAAMARKGLASYRVIACPLSNLGIKIGMALPVDTSPVTLADLQTGAVVVARIAPKEAPEGSVLVLRQFVAPGLLTTNRPRRNAALSIDDEDLAVTIVGVAFDVVSS